MKNLDQITAPLHRLTEKGKMWSWSAECDQAFGDLKQKLISAPVLAYPNFELEFTVDCDASSEGLGAVLSQNHEGNEGVISYASRTLSKSEQQYCVMRSILMLTQCPDNLVGNVDIMNKQRTTLHKQRAAIPFHNHSALLTSGHREKFKHFSPQIQFG